MNGDGFSQFDRMQGQLRSVQLEFVGGWSVSEVLVALLLRGRFGGVFHLLDLVLFDWGLDDLVVGGFGPLLYLRPCVG